MASAGAGRLRHGILRQASKGLPRQAGRLLCSAMRLAVPRGLNVGHNTCERRRAAS